MEKADKQMLKLKTIAASVRQQTSCCQSANSSLCIAILTSRGTVKGETKTFYSRPALCPNEMHKKWLQTLTLCVLFGTISLVDPLIRVALLEPMKSPGVGCC